MALLTLLTLLVANLFQIFEILVCFAQHPNGEREFKVGISYCTRLVEYAFDGFLWPRAVLEGTTSGKIVQTHCIVKCTDRQLTRHDESDCALNRLRIGITCVHQSHDSPARLYNLTIFVLYPLALFARLER
jgi:hypothetical protein